ncbi:MAG: TlpA family protein disulfide reductase [Campylobacteraceae bacterium]|nr:TlpA family protein disulfide reductase [Campylobacteraceae bacterium]
MQFKKIAFFAILSLLVFTACDSKNNKNDNVKKEKVISYPTIILKQVNGQEIEIKTSENKLTIKNYENKVILLSFFATWCPPCKAEIPHLINLQNKYKKDFEIISVLVSDKKTNEELTSFISEYKINYALTNGEANNELAKHLGGIRTIPTMFMLKKDGTIMEKYLGMVPEEMLESDIQRAIK